MERRSLWKRTLLESVKGPDPIVPRSSIRCFSQILKELIHPLLPVFVLFHLTLSSLVAAPIEDLQWWQEIPIPTGREQFFVNHLITRLDGLNSEDNLNYREDESGNLIVEWGLETTEPEVAFAAFMDEPTFSIDAVRQQRYFGVKPLFADSLTPERIRGWLGNPLLAVSSEGQTYPCTFAVPSPSSFSNEGKQFWKGLLQDHLFLDTGLWPEQGRQIGIVDRVVRRRYLDRLNGGFWVGYDLGTRLMLAGLWQMVLKAEDEDPIGPVHFVFLASSRKGHEGLKTYLETSRPQSLVLLRATPDAAEFELMHNSSLTESLWTRRLNQNISSVPSEMSEILREFSLISTPAPPALEKLQELVLLVVRYPIRQPVLGMEAVPADPGRDVNINEFFERVVEWIDD